MGWASSAEAWRCGRIGSAPKQNLRCLVRCKVKWYKCLSKNRRKTVKLGFWLKWRKTVKVPELQKPYPHTL